MSLRKDRDRASRLADEEERLWKSSPRERRISTAGEKIEPGHRRRFELPEVSFSEVAGLHVLGGSADLVLISFLIGRWEMLPQPVAAAAFSAPPYLFGAGEPVYVAWGESVIIEVQNNGTWPAAFRARLL